MRPIVLRSAFGAFLATTLALGLSIGLPAHRDLVLGVYVLVLGGIVIGSILAALQESAARTWDETSPLERPPQRPPRSEQIAELDRLDRVVVLATSGAFDVHHRLRPLVRELAAERLYAQHGVELADQPERARELLGPELWDLVRPDRELGRRYGPGLAVDEIAPLVERLEAL